MINRLLILLILSSLVSISFAQDVKHFDQKRFSVYQGFRSIHTTKHLNETQLDFLNYLYTEEDASDYQYFEMASRLRHLDTYQIDLRIALYNNLIPYCYNFSFDYFINPSLAVEIGSLGNRYYLTEFNGFYDSMFENKITTRYIQRQWNLSLLGFYIGPRYQFNYQTIHVDFVLRGGMASIYPFTQKNIIKEPQSNYKLVFDYQSKFYFLPFVMPELELSIDFIQYKNAIIGGRIKYALLYTKTAINYNLTKYEWTYDSPETVNVQLSNHSFIQSDFDFGIYVKW